jgi:hypothetical protein
MFLRDDGTEFEPDPPLIRGRVGSTFPLKATAIPRVAWDAAWSLPEEFEAPPWDTLWLDASKLLPDIGPALVLAYSALEARITSALDVLVSTSGFDADLWSWISERGGDFAKQPSIRDRFGPLLKALGGKGLDEDPELWEAFLNLREARNRFAHDGTPTIGGRAVTIDRANELVRGAAEILVWIDALLPEEHRQPRLEVPEDQRLDLTKMVLGPRETRQQGMIAFRDPQPRRAPGGK